MDNVKKDRFRYIGGSDMPSILGTDKFGGTAYKLAQEKAQTTSCTFDGNRYTEYGKDMEPQIRSYINYSENRNFEPQTKIDGMYRGNADGVDGKTLLEIKTYGKEFDAAYHKPQCLMYMAIFGLEDCLLVGYRRPDDFSTDFDPENITIERFAFDVHEWSGINEKCNKFWRAVVKMRSDPDMNESEFNELYHGAEIALTATRLAEVENKLKALKAVEDECKAVRADMYEQMYKHGVKQWKVDTFTISLIEPSVSKKFTIDETLLRMKYPEILAEVGIEKTTAKSGYVRITERKSG